MPSIEENKSVWGSSYDWSRAGDEWSENYGTPHSQWFGCIYPRIFPFLKGKVLEIAPGYGRWTQFLILNCTSLIGVDLSSQCVEHCKLRFQNLACVEFEVNDGLGLPMIGDASIDFVFSFNSLVHAEADVMSSYIDELARVLKPNGTAFVHHSNLGAVHRSLWQKVRRAGRPYSREWRAYSMSAEKMRGFVTRAGMSCIQQELVPWGTGWPVLIDCMTTIINAGGIKGRIVKNRRFMEEASVIKWNQTFGSATA